MQTPIIETVIKASEILRGCKLDITAIEENVHLVQLNEYFNTSTIETIILITIFQLSAENNRIDREDMAKFLDCNPIQFFKYEESFSYLYLRGFFEKQSTFSRKMHYQLSDPLHYSIINNKKLEITGIVKKTDPIEVLSNVVQLIEDREDNNTHSMLLLSEFSRCVIEHKHIPFFRELDAMDLNLTEKLSWLFLIERKINGIRSVDIETIGEKIFSKSSERINFCNSLHNKSNRLMAQNWIDFADGGFVNAAQVTLTPKSKKFINPLGICIRMDDLKTGEQLIKPKQIRHKKLFFNPAEAEQIADVGKSLKFRNHNKIKKRLQTQGLRTGICTLLYGAPGTGKTETVYQIAKETGRSLWKVDLTELKSMWYGESQKKVKELFTDYKELCKSESRTPILLLNEADAILGTRRPNATSGSGSADNAIQNIFLDCLEDFEGILFATTNLEKSLDEAFERRFLFKIKFERPKQKAREQIWKSTLKELTNVQAKILSETYDLSGGEIENVLRKLAMMRVLEDKVAVFECVKKLCENEQLGLKGKRMGIGYFK